MAAHMNDMDKVTRIIERIERKYDASNDIIPDAPKVTHTEMELMLAVKHLVARVEKLERQFESMDEFLRNI